MITDKKFEVTLLIGFWPVDKRINKSINCIWLIINKSITCIPMGKYLWVKTFHFIDDTTDQPVQLSRVFPLCMNILCVCVCVCVFYYFLRERGTIQLGHSTEF